MATSMRSLFQQQLNGCLLLRCVRQSRPVLFSQSNRKGFSSSTPVSTVGSELQDPEVQTSPTCGVAESSLHHDDYFGVKQMVSLSDLFQARVHLGHNAGLRHPSMAPYIFGERQGTDIMDLEQTLPLLHHALDVCCHIVYRGGMVLFLSRNMQMLPWVERMAREVGEYSHCRPWKRGIFTDAEAVFGTLSIYPELCVFLNTQDTVFETHRGVVEAAKLLIPTIGVVDSNCDRELITYPIPGNDDSPASTQLFLRVFREAILKAKAKRVEDGLADSVKDL